MLAALTCQSAGVVPCSFMLFGGLWSASKDYLSFIKSQINLGLDSYVQIPPRMPGLISDSYNLHGLPVTYDPRVEIEEWIEKHPDRPYPTLVKIYHTPAGDLRTEVHQTADWRWGNHVPFLDDYLSSRSLKFLIESPSDLEKLAYLLVPPAAADLRDFRENSRSLVEFAAANNLLLVGGWGVGADVLGWIFGLQNMLYAVYDSPELINSMLQMISSWNRSRMEVVLDAGIDLYIKRAWYENCDFWTPNHYQQHLAPILRDDVDLAHSKGARFGYLITSNCMPLLEIIADCGVDVLIGVDPKQWDLDATAKKLGGRVCLWGGVNGHLTVENGSSNEVLKEVRQAMEILASTGGFILSPVDNIRDFNPQAQENILVLIAEWQRLTKSS